MKIEKILLYGASNKSLRIKVAGYLADNYEVIGVTDRYQKSDTLQGERFVDPASVAGENFKYCIVLINNKINRKDAVAYLESLGVERNKIVEPLLFFVNEAECIPDLKREIQSASNESPQNLILGLSYSLRGIDYSAFTDIGGVLDLLWHGQDLYYNCMVLSEVRKKQKIFNGIKRIICVFPFYYFNYDMSCSLYQFESGQILANRGFNDWHNAYDKNDDIRNFLVCFELFGERFWYNKRWKKTQPNNEMIMSNNLIDLDPIWRKTYLETWKENIWLFEDLINMSREKELYLVIPPIWKPVIKKKDIPIYEQMVKSFENVIAPYIKDIHVIDFSGEICSMDCFYDYEHLNNKGRRVFTQMLMETIKREQEVF